MSNLPISNSQPAKNAANASRMDFAADTDGQAAEPFAKVLARQVDEAEVPAPETGTDPSAAGQDAAQSILPSVDPTALQADPMAAILLQIPLEVRTAMVTDRAARLASGDRLAVGFDAAALQANAAVQATLLPAAGPGAATAQRTERLDPIHSGEAIGEAAGGDIKAAIQVANERRDAIIATGRPETQSINQEQRVFADLLRQGGARGSDMAATPADMTAPQPQNMSAAPLSVTSVTAPSTSPTQTVATPLGSPAWADDFSQKVGWMVSQRNQVAELHLNPPNLGPLDIVLKISDNQATALFTSPHAAVREAVENALPKLRDLLADNGIMLSNATVGDQSPRERHEASAGRRAGSSAPQGEEPNEQAGQTVVRPARLHDGMVDTFA